MSVNKRVNKVYNSAQEINIDDSSKIVLMSDCHRGDSGLTDDFSKNQNLYFHALNHYYNKNYTYIELGDGDELWENKRLSDIKQAHSDAFWMLSRFYKHNRLYMLYGNHDIVKRKNRFVAYNLYEFYDEREKKSVPLFENIKVHEGLVLNYTPTANKILLIHGHQADFANYRLWRLSRFLVRYFWRPIEAFGVNEPTSPAKNYKKKDEVSSKLIAWSKKENKMMIAGHTHKPVYPEVGEPLYFNDGSCVHPRCITAIEIANGEICLVKWNVQTRSDATMFVGREVIAGPVKLKAYFHSNDLYGMTSECFPI